MSSNPVRTSGRRQALALLAAVTVLPLLSRSALEPKRHAASRLPAARDEASRLAGLCSGANPLGVGLLLECFSEANFRGQRIASVVTPTIDYGSFEELPDRARQVRPGSMRWSGWVKAHVAGRFSFDARSPDARLTVSGIAFGGPEAVESPGLEMAAGRYYPVRVELQNISDARFPVRLQWLVPYGSHYTVPRQLLFTPTESVKSA